MRHDANFERHRKATRRHVLLREMDIPTFSPVSPSATGMG